MKSLALVPALLLALTSLPLAAQEGESCSTAAPKVQASEVPGEGQNPELEREGDLTAAQVDKVVEFMAKTIADTGSPSFTREEILKATGVIVTLEDAPLLQAEVFLKLEDMGIDALSGSRCSDYGACSLYGDLSGATGEILAMYEREKKEDGKVYAGKALPDFTAYRMNGDMVSSDGLKGQETVLAFLAVHCRHSLDSLPILNRLSKELSDVNVVGVYINSGSWEDVADWLPELEPQFDVWVRNDDELGDLFSGHLVPAYFFVNENGEITKKLVGFKEADQVVAEVGLRAHEAEAPAGD